MLENFAADNQIDRLRMLISARICNDVTARTLSDIHASPDSVGKVALDAAVNVTAPKLETHKSKTTGSPCAATL